MILEIVTCLSIAALPGAFWAGHEWGKRRYRVPMTKAAHTDEYLYQNAAGEFVPYQPPKYVPEGASPVQAGWDMTRGTGILHHTRRVGD